MVTVPTPSGIRPLPTLTCTDPTVDRLYAAALRNVFELNTVSDAGGGRFVRAGGDYPTPWTRDAAINSWSAVSLLAPDLAESTLRAVTESTDHGPIVAQDDQWWDQAIWILGAHRHVELSQDAEFARWAHEVGRHTLDALEARFDPRWNLYRGPAVMQDGVSGYPLPTGAAEVTSFVLDHPWSEEIMCPSTNVVYAAAHERLADLADLAGAPAVARLRSRAAAVWEAIEATLWLGDHYGYLVHADGTVADYQELLGLALLLEHAPIDENRVRAVVASVRREPFGVPLVTPHFPRYSSERPGRHNVMLWPMATGQWGVAAARRGQAAAFADSWRDLCRLIDPDAGFFEVYRPSDGTVDGGWQVGRTWDSVPDQTWSATAFLRMVHEGLFGIRLADGELRLAPTVPEGLGTCELRGLSVGAARVTIRVTGVGNRVAAVDMDGRTLDAGEPIRVADLRGEPTLHVRMRD
ncbi:MGH1-like glycoside hydrolase domain-containing protein [Occultella kanbiaonis]|uniref:MGH1-like glycoside hydrolase domain-containing protein n=1 Tax=Occultella kanbiaonis TaxID=2675754 RepID=UPI00143CE07C|nr:hypothetical protein [Occultella kanbiaonis]